MQKLLIEIIQKIIETKKRQNKIPDFATRKEIMHELIARMDIELEALTDTGKLKTGNNINDTYFEL